MTWTITDALRARVGTSESKTTAVGPVLASVWTCLHGPGAFLNVETAPTTLVQLVAPRPGSAQFAWRFDPPAGVLTYDVTIYRWVQLGMGQQQQTSLVAEGVEVEEVHAALPGGRATVLRVEHDGDRMLAVISGIVLSSGSLPFAAASGFTKSYRCR